MGGEKKVIQLSHLDSHCIHVMPRWKDVAKQKKKKKSYMRVVYEECDGEG